MARCGHVAQRHTLTVEQSPARSASGSTPDSGGELCTGEYSSLQLFLKA